MHYKTIVMELLEQQPALYEQLRQSRSLLATINQYALDLKARHTAWMDELARTRPGSAPSQLASEALELALEDIQADLRQQSPTMDDEQVT